MMWQLDRLRSSRRMTRAPALLLNISLAFGYGCAHLDPAPTPTFTAASITASTPAGAPTAMPEPAEPQPAFAANAPATRRDSSTAVAATPASMGATNGARAAKVAEGNDDSIIAARLRRAAEQEANPELKSKLWEEYFAYKRNTHVRKPTAVWLRYVANARIVAIMGDDGGNPGLALASGAWKSCRGLKRFSCHCAMRGYS